MGAAGSSRGQDAEAGDAAEMRNRGLYKEQVRTLSCPISRQFSSHLAQIDRDRTGLISLMQR